MQRFLPGPPETRIALNPEEQARKRAMLDCFVTQSAMLSRFGVSVDWFDAPPDAGIVAATPGAWSDGAACPALPLTAIPGSIRRKRRMGQNRADRAGGRSVEDAGPAGLGTLVALHQSRWNAAQEPGVLTDPAVLRCLQTALPRLHETGLLRLQVLRVGGGVAAAILALVGPGWIVFYLSGYDAARAFVSPGTILLGAMPDQAIAEGRSEAHFLRGREACTYAWGAEDRFSKAAASRQTSGPNLTLGPGPVR